MSSVVKLVSYAPGSISSIEYPLGLGNVMRFNFELKRLQPCLQEHVPSSPAGELTAPSTSDSVNGLVSDDLTAEVRKKRGGYYDNILEKLERKYTDPNFKVDDSEEDQDTQLPDAKKSKKRTRAQNVELYDEDDGFIDDSEALVDMDQVLKMKSVKTEDLPYV